MIDFERKYFVKDLLKPETLLKDTSYLEFASFEDFIDTVVRNSLLGDLKSVDKIIVPVEEDYQVKALMHINSDAIPFLIISLKKVSKTLFDAFSPRKNTALMIDASEVSSFKKELKSCKSPAMLSFCKGTYGYFRDVVNCENINNIPYVFTDPFFQFPFFCIADIAFDYKNLQENLTLDTLHSIQYFGNMLAFNTIKTKKGSVDWGSFSASPVENSGVTYTFDLARQISPKRLFVEKNCLYVNSGNLQDSKVDLTSSSSIPEGKILDSIRKFYDAKFTAPCGLTDCTFISLEENVKCTGDPNVIPYLTYFVTRAFNGEHI